MKSKKYIYFNFIVLTFFVIVFLNLMILISSEVETD